MNQLSVEELKKYLDSGRQLNLVDVREPEEYAEFNIGGTLIPLSKIMNFEFDAIEDLKDQELYVYCRSGKRSMQACVYLEQAGFSKVFNINGGLLAWQSLFEK